MRGHARVRMVAGIGAAVLIAFAIWSAWDLREEQRPRASPSPAPDSRTAAAEIAGSSQTSPAESVSREAMRTPAVVRHRVRLADGTPLPETEFELIDNAAPAMEVATPVPVMVSDEAGTLPVLPESIALDRISLKCTTFPWLPAARFEPDRSGSASGAFVVPGGRLDVTVSSRQASEVAVHVQVRSESGSPVDPRRLTTTLDGTATFLLVESGSYSIHGVTADQRLYAESEVDWHPGMAPVSLVLSEPGSGFLDLSVLDENGFGVHPFAVRVEADGFRRLVHSEDLPFHSLLSGLPEGRVSVELVQRLVLPPSLYRPGQRKLVTLSGGEVTRVVFSTSLYCVLAIEVSGEVTGEWEVHRHDVGTGVEARVEIRRYLEGGGVEIRRNIRAEGTYHVVTDSSLPVRLRFERADPEAFVDIDVAPLSGVVTTVTVRLH